MVSIRREQEGAQLLMAQTGWLRGHIASIPGKGLTPSNQSYTDKPFITFAVSKQDIHTKYTWIIIVKSKPGTSKILRLINKGKYIFCMSHNHVL